MDEKEFIVNDITYLIISEKNGKSWKQIVFKNDKTKRPKNQKQVVRDYGSKIGDSELVEIPTDSSINTHMAVEKLYNKLPDK